MKRALAMTLLLALAACAASAGPPEIRYGEDACQECQMTIDQARYAAAYRLANGDTLRFDDLGDMLVHLASTGHRPTEFWVGNYQHDGWLRAEKASFVRSSALETPMGHGLVALPDRQAAAALAATKDGQVLSWQQLQDLGGKL